MGALKGRTASFLSFAAPAPVASETGMPRIQLIHKRGAALIRRDLAQDIGEQSEAESRTGRRRGRRHSSLRAGHAHARHLRLRLLPNLP